MIQNFPDKEADQDILFGQLWSKYPALVNAKSALQIGGRGASCLDTFRRLRSKGITYCGLLEIWPPNIEKLCHEKSINEFRLGDVRHIEELVPGSFDVIVHWHGPEHLSKEDFTILVPKLTKKCNVLIIGCPYGEWKQDALYGNPNEKHISSWYPEEFEAMGFDVFVFGQKADNHNVLCGILETKK